MKNEYTYRVGQLVHHGRYGYRGVVAGRDPFCKADESWYRGNLTQPDRDQPWYHILVHGSAHTTYVAQENLETDPGGEQVVHPLTGKFFEHFARDGYQARDGVRFPSMWSPSPERQD